jgi:hypothetical protein
MYGRVICIPRVVDAPEVGVSLVSFEDGFAPAYRLGEKACPACEGVSSKPTDRL